MVCVFLNFMNLDCKVIENISVKFLLICNNLWFSKESYILIIFYGEKNLD